MKITVIVNSLVQGGAQRFTIDLLEELIKRDFKIRLITFYPQETDFFDLPERVEVVRLIHPFHDNGRNPRIFFKVWKSPQISLNRIYWRLQDLKTLKGLLKDADSNLTLCIERYVGVLVGLVHPNSKPLIISERVHPDYHEIPFPFNKLTYLVYRRRNLHLHAQGQVIADAVTRVHKKKPFVIPNAVSAPRNTIATEIRPSDGKKLVISVGRYAHQKGFDLLISAWHILPVDIREAWKLEIYGDGDRTEYENILRDLDLQDSVHLNTASRDISEKLQNADIFILTSRYEGFPNALAEAMARGISCIATDSPSAVRDLTMNGTLAVLCEINAQAIASELSKLMKNENLRKEIGSKSTIVSELYSAKKITEKWVQKFHEIIEQK